MNMNQQALKSVPCVDGIDVVQLLRDLGEASAATSAVDLFRLCLSAQRVLPGLCVASYDGNGGGSHEL